VVKEKELLAQRAINLNNADLNNKEKDLALLLSSKNAETALQDNNNQEVREEREEKSKQRDPKIQSTVLLKEDLELEEEKKPSVVELERPTGELRKMTKRPNKKLLQLNKLQRRLLNNSLLRLR
jgi:hypothetical protein